MLKLENIGISKNGLEILKNVNLKLEKGEIVALIGPSGCGKTTLLNIISGLEKDFVGSISREDNSRISYMFQDARLLPWRTVRQNISLAAPERNDADSLIEAVGLKGFENYYSGELSGGMAKRVALARAFFRDGDYYLMDEPFQALDYGTRLEMVKLLLSIWQKKRPGVLFVTHEIDEALMIASRVVLISKRPGTITEEFALPGEEGRDYASPSLSAYRQRIIECVTGGDCETEQYNCAREEDRS